MHLGEIFLLIAGSLAVTAFARRLGWSAPLAVMAVAFVVSVIPGVPTFEVDGELILNLVLPPLLYSASLDVTYLNFRSSIRQIRRLGLFLPIVTAVAAGFLAWSIVPELGLPIALLLGAIVAPSDAVSAASIGRRLGLPRRVMSVLSGESLVNDATSLTMFKVFSAIAVGATVTVVDGLVSFGLAVVVGIGIGLVIGWLVVLVRRRLDDPVLLGTASLLVPFAAYAIAERFQGSGVLAVVAAGILIGYRAPETGYATRLQERPIWQSIDLLLEGVVFAIIGLQLKVAVVDVADSPIGLTRSLLLAAAVLATVIVVRAAWVFAGYGFARWLGGLIGPALRRRGRSYRQEPRLDRRELTVISWAGMRGVVTLATAASVPLFSGDRTVVGTVFLAAFVVTVGTLLLQGLTLPLVITRLGVFNADEREQDRRDIRRVLRLSAEEGLARIEDERAAWRERYGAETADRVLDALERRLRRDERREDAAEQQAADATAAGRRVEVERLTREWIAARRRVVIRERDAGAINEEVVRELLAALDAEELALDAGSSLSSDARGEAS